MTTLELPESRAVSADLKSAQAEARSTHARINIPLNIEGWKHLDEDTQADLIWYHQHCLDEGLGNKEAAAALGYGWSTVWRVLNGVYEGSWKNIVGAIRSYRRLHQERGTIQKNEFVETPVSRMIFEALRYALANNSITLIVGESRMGKTVSALAWKEANNHGRAVYIIAPTYGGTKALLTAIAAAVGVNRNLSAVAMHQAILRAFNRNRILIVDEAHRLLPGDRRTNPVNLEMIRDLHDRTGAAVALLATQRFDAALKASEYMFEQLLGRIGLPVRLPRKLTNEAVEPILKQYLPRPSARALETAVQMANERGRLGILVENLKVASKLAAKDGEKLREEHFLKAIGIRKGMMGELVYAAKS